MPWTYVDERPHIARLLPRIEGCPVDTAFLVLRLVIGLYIAAHGAQKLFGWFGGSGFTASRTVFAAHLGFRPATLWALAAGIAELGGGLLLALGLLWPLGPIGIAAAMGPAIAIHWPQGPWATRGGYELPLTNLVTALALGLSGPGAYALDVAFGLNVPSSVAVPAAVLALLGVVLAIVTRHRPAVAAAGA
jgi:putative oxidoreductase